MPDSPLDLLAPKSRQRPVRPRHAASLIVLRHAPGGLEILMGTRGAKARLVRDGTIVYEGEIASLRRFNDDVREVQTGFECGVVLKDYMDVKEGDVIEVYETRQVERTLS